MNQKILCFTLFIATLLQSLNAQQLNNIGNTIDVASIASLNEFSWGVRAFHEGYYSRALLNFEKALILKPREPLYRMWLGFANYYAGLDDSAITQWETVMNNSSLGGAWLQNRVAMLLYRKSPYYDNISSDPWVARSEIAEPITPKARFLRPTSVRTDPLSGSIYLTGYANNSILKYDISGNLEAQFKGGFLQFDGPYDVIPLSDGRFFVTEFHANRISLVSKGGLRIHSFGTSKDQGSLKGPQFMATDDNGYLYVTDWGGKRVVKYDLEGNFIMSIGLNGASFLGMSQPTGIAIGLKELYVADGGQKAIHVFDHSGNFLRTMVKSLLSQPEGLNLYQNRHLLIADGQRLMILDLEDEVLTLLTDLNGKARNIFQSTFDRNGNLVIIDNMANNVTHLTPLSTLYGGLSIDIRRIITDRWPVVTLETIVQNRQGNNIIGLKESNFILFENNSIPKPAGLSPTSFTVVAADSNVLAPLDASLMLEASPQALAMSNLFVKGISDLYSHIGQRGTLNFSWASSIPVSENASTNLEALTIYRDKLADMSSDQWRFDASLRLAASQLIPSRGRQAVFFLTTGNYASTAFMQYRPEELISYLKNNGIAFYPIYVNSKQRNQSYDYIATETGGISSYLYRPEGLGSLVNIARNRTTGLYYISYNSPVDLKNNELYQTIDLEVLIQKESGRTHSGFFPPLLQKGRSNW